MKNILGNKKSLDKLVPIEAKDFVLFGFGINKKYQPALMVLISLILLVNVGSFRSFLIGMGSVLLGLAVIGSYFRNRWVQYSFFAWGLVIYLRSLVLLLASLKRGMSSILQLDTAIDMFVLQCFITLPFFCAGYLAILFFDESTKLHNNSKSANLAIAFGVGICALMSPSLLHIIANSSILPTPQVLIERAIAFGVSEKWLLTVVTLPTLIFNMLCSVMVVFMLGLLFRVWSRWHTIIASLFVITLFFSVGVINFFVMKINERWSSIQFFADGELVLLPVIGIVLGKLIGGLLATLVKKRIGSACHPSKHQ